MNFANMTESQRQQRNAQLLAAELDKDEFPEEWEYQEVAHMIKELAAKAARYDWPIKQLGSLNDGSDNIVTLYQDDVTRTAVIRVGATRIFCEDRGDFDAAFADGMKKAPL